MARSKKREALSLSDALAEIKKSYGENIWVEDPDRLKNLEYLPTGFPHLDRVLNGGYAKGRIYEIFGVESGGKTTVALHAIRGLQAQGLKSAFIDVEQAFSPDHARLLGVDPEDKETFLLFQPGNGEDALNIVETLASTGEIAFIVVDSVSALLPRSEQEGEMGDASVGTQARLVGKAVRKLTPVLQQTGTVLFFINQVREKVGVMFGSPETTSGGRALPFAASVRLRISVKERKEGEYTKSALKIIKNKLTGKTLLEVPFTNYLGQGVSAEESLVDVAIAEGIYPQSGSYYTDEEGKKVHRSKLIQRVENDPALFEDLYRRAVTEPIKAEKDYIQNLLLRKQGKEESFNPETGEIIE